MSASTFNMFNPPSGHRLGFVSAREKAVLRTRRTFGQIGVKICRDHYSFEEKKILKIPTMRIESAVCERGGTTVQKFWKILKKIKRPPKRFFGGLFASRT